MKVILPQEIDYSYFSKLVNQKRKAGNPGTKRKVKYKDVVCAFDIETTRIKHLDQSVMYMWQYSFNNDFVVIGRKWNEFCKMLDNISWRLRGAKLVTYVHNLSYEFQFLAGIFNFEIDDVFAVKSRRVLKANCGPLEFRCSYLHSNRSLDAWCKKLGTPTQKLTGGIDYNQEVYPDDPLDDKHIRYGVNDVVCLVEAIKMELDKDGDTLYSIPLTSTGYIRRKAKNALRGWFLDDLMPSWEVYELLREAFMGGDTHANRYYVGLILSDVKSVDIKSSYPSDQCNEVYPIRPFSPLGDLTKEGILQAINVRDKAVVMRLALTDVKLKNEYEPAPYIPQHKCRNLVYNKDDATIKYVDNGRVLRCDYMEITVTDIDLRIILRQYNIGAFVCTKAYQSSYGRLPVDFIRCVQQLFVDKTCLEGVDEYNYNKSKNEINSCYGMSAQDPGKISDVYVYDDVEEVKIFKKDTRLEPEEVLIKNNNKAVMPYQWGVWTTAWARYRLDEGRVLLGDQVVYWDTDSLKYVGDCNFSEINDKRKKRSIETGSYADAPDGSRKFMGLFEQEKGYDRFITWGSKKYAFEKNGKIGITIAGVNKEKGAMELKEKGGLQALKPGFTFEKGGGLESVYNDKVDCDYITPRGNTIRITRNTCLRPSTYTLGLEGEYHKLLTMIATRA